MPLRQLSHQWLAKDRERANRMIEAFTAAIFVILRLQRCRHTTQIHTALLNEGGATEKEINIILMILCYVCGGCVTRQGGL